MVPCSAVCFFAVLKNVVPFVLKSDDMPDNFQETGIQDDIRINTHQPHEVTYCTNELNITPEVLEKAVSEAGPMVKNVREWLTKNPR